MTDPTTATAQIDATLAALPADQRAALQTLRQTIAAAAPTAEEAISYGMPAFRYRKRPLVSYAAFKAHCSLFPMSSALIETHRDELAGFATAKGTLRFTPEHPLPNDVVEWIVRERWPRSTGAERRAARCHTLPVSGTSGRDLELKLGDVRLVVGILAPEREDVDPAGVDVELGANEAVDPQPIHRVVPVVARRAHRQPPRDSARTRSEPHDGPQPSSPWRQGFGPSRP